MNSPELRERCAGRLLAAQPRINELKVFIGLDGFVDEILHVVDKRENAEKYLRLAKISQFSERLAGAAGQSTNIELVSQLTKLGGNGPIMANAMASFGARVTYLGILGYPNLHPVFEEFSKRAEVHSIAAPGCTDALEFEDGKIMMGKHQSLKEMNWENIQSRFGKEKFAEKISGSDLVSFLNWTMLARMNEIWEAALKEICPALKGARRKMFFDLCDPEKRTPADIWRALELIAGFENYFDVTLGLNEKESAEIGKVLGLDTSDHSPDGLCKLGQEILQRVPVQTMIIHPTTYALAVGKNGASVVVDGAFAPKPLITTGAGDHFNSGFCLGKLLGFDDELCLLTGVTTSGYYVRTAKSPAPADLAKLLRNWPVENSVSSGSKCN
ncbi:MAG: PfkB family carbohydrate kinase [Limisphaerales bacterium]